MAGIVNAIDDTDFGDSSADTAIPGLASWEVNVGGPWNSTVDGYLSPEAVAPSATLQTLVVAIGTASTVTYTWTAATTVGAFITNWSIDASSPTDMITWSGTLKCSGAPVVS